jgi:hypothetical protein
LKHDCEHDWDKESEIRKCGGYFYVKICKKCGIGHEERWGLIDGEYAKALRYGYWPPKESV